MPHDLVWNVDTELHGEERCVCSCGEPPKLKIVCYPANVTSCSVRSLVDHPVDISGEGFDKASLSRLASHFNRAKPESEGKKVVV